MRLSLDKQIEYAREMLPQLSDTIGESLVDELLNADQSSETGIKEQRQRIAVLKQRLAELDDPRVTDLLSLADVLVRKSVWILGGDGWAYDIGYGGLDHVLASGRNVNVLVLDTQVYSNTGGQASKATPRAAVAKFASQGKGVPRKDLGMIAMSYGYIYVAQVAMGSSDQQTLNAFLEADAYDGPSLIIAYSHCIAHGYDLIKGLDQQKLAVESGVWPLYRFNPTMIDEGKNPLKIDSKEPKIPVRQFAYNETRYRMLLQSNEQRAESLINLAQEDAERRWMLYRQMADMHYKADTDDNGNKNE
jgi:pyruvate-ferredoxin/flavodoxin oxidoreductase